MWPESSEGQVERLVGPHLVQEPSPDLGSEVVQDTKNGMKLPSPTMSLILQT